MGLEKHRSHRHFSLDDLGILDGPQPRAISTIVRLAARGIGVPICSLYIFDDTTATLFLRASIGINPKANGMADTQIDGSIANMVRTEIGTITIEDLSILPHAASVERQNLGAGAYMGCPVFGPANEPVGVLAAMYHGPHTWTLNQIRLAEDMAFLISQSIMLKATLETLKIISRERRGADFGTGYSSEQ